MHCAISLLADHALIGLVAFGTQVHLYELGFSDLSKIYVFPGTKESRPATLFGCRHRSSPATFPLEDRVVWMAVLFPSSVVSIAAADISFVDIVAIGSRAPLPARLLQGRLASLLCRDRLQSQRPDFDRHLLSLHRSSHLLDLARSNASLLSFVCSTANFADQVSRKVRELDLKTLMAPPSSNLSSPYPSSARSLLTWVSRSSGWRFPPRLLRLRRPSPWRSPRRSPPSWVHTGKNMKQRK